MRWGRPTPGRVVGSTSESSRAAASQAAVGDIQQRPQQPDSPCAHLRSSSPGCRVRCACSSRMHSCARPASHGVATGRGQWLVVWADQVQRHCGSQHRCRAKATPKLSTRASGSCLACGCRHVQRRRAGSQAGWHEGRCSEAQRQQRRVQLCAVADQLSDCRLAAAQHRKVQGAEACVCAGVNVPAGGRAVNRATSEQACSVARAEFGATAQGQQQQKQPLFFGPLHTPEHLSFTLSGLTAPHQSHLAPARQPPGSGRPLQQVEQEGGGVGPGDRFCRAAVCALNVVQCSIRSIQKCIDVTKTPPAASFSVHTWQADGRRQQQADAGCLSPCRSIVQRRRSLGVGGQRRGPGFQQLSHAVGVAARGREAGGGFWSGRCRRAGHGCIKRSGGHHLHHPSHPSAPVLGC